ncbi:hypothetical protein COV82_05075 [Candidatus Peregrinibacteria bacterium CG11_big_fil_rev_8_21_14_0_20_46_8]|nr:MAG: hypothetical protein COV82_05075 [Candidatus Peregrinibacteria bacterium CG11_big_fil_rev_8_21_14_0_20_46_8]
MPQFSKISEGVVHTVPADLKKILTANPVALATWNNITPLARNEWICWIESVKKAETRKAHIERAAADLKKGKRRPCCWMGCIHRTDKAISPSVQGILNKRNKPLK